MLTLPARGCRDAEAPIGLPPVGAVPRRSGVHALRLGVWVFASGVFCGQAGAGGIGQTAKGGGRYEMRGIPCAPDVKPRHPGAECVLRLRSGLENGKRLSGINQRNAFESLARRKG